MRTLFIVPFFFLVGCQTSAMKVELLEPITSDSKIIQISGQVSRSGCIQEKPIPLALFHLIKMSSGEIVAVKRSKPFPLEKDQNSYSVEIKDYNEYQSLAICPDYSVDSNFNLDTTQCFGHFERKWMLIFSKKMPSQIGIDLQIKDCSPNLMKPKEATIRGCE